MSATFEKGMLGNQTASLPKFVTILDTKVPCSQVYGANGSIFVVCAEVDEAGKEKANGLNWQSLEGHNGKDTLNGIEHFATLKAGVSGVNVKESPFGLNTACPVPTLKELAEANAPVTRDCEIRFTGPSTVL